jgi:aryl-alcohol dehydrogenase-like predicted oxidoreductase
MRSRTFGRTGWQVSEVGYGMWGLAGWTGSDDEEVRASLELAVELGCTFFETAWAYGDGRSEQILGELVRANPERRLYAATKVPPKNRVWPTRRGFALDDVFPADYIREYAERSLENLGLERIDLLQFHVWEDDWANDERWRAAMEEFRRQGLVGAVGVSINRWEPWNVLRTLETGAIDAVQVIYNWDVPARARAGEPGRERRGLLARRARRAAARPPVGPDAHRVVAVAGTGLETSGRGGRSA